MSRTIVFALLAGACLVTSTHAQPLSLDAGTYANDELAAARPIRLASNRASMGGGFIEFLFGGGDSQPRYGSRAAPMREPTDDNRSLDPRYLPQTVAREWPDWRPPPEMLQRRPDLPTFMAGGPENPLGARSLYLGSSLYRIHGSNEPWTIGTQVSSGCIRMRNEDVIDLYERVKVGTRVVVM